MDPCYSAFMYVCMYVCMYIVEAEQAGREGKAAKDMLTRLKQVRLHVKEIIFRFLFSIYISSAALAKCMYVRACENPN